MRDNSQQKYYWANEKSLKMLRNGYIKSDQTIQERVQEIALEFERISGLPGIGAKFEHCVARGWFSLASPIWANYGAGRGLSISCNGSYIHDSISGIFTTAIPEIACMTKNGAGTSAYFGDIRPKGAKISTSGFSDGPVRFMEMFEKTTNIVSQNGVRRGSMAAYLPVSHPDILDFLKCREHGHAIQDLSIGVCIDDKFMEELTLPSDQISQHTKDVMVALVSKKFNDGYPYILFTGNANKNKPQVYKDKNMEILASNLCNEIMLPSNNEESFVCCLSSMNLLHYDEWKDTDAVKIMTYFLDSVIEDYIRKTNNIPEMARANRFAKRHRAVGIGVLGWHSYLLSNRIAFDSMKAKMLTNQIFSNINNKSLEASKELANVFGEPEVLKGYGERMTCRMAIAPTTSSAFILGQVSQSIEPLDSNYFTEDNAKGMFIYKNPYLIELLQEKNKDEPEVWQSILIRGGSVQHLDFLNEDEKNVFKTFSEISQKEIMIQAAIRQKYIDQGQSLNIKVSTEANARDIKDLIIFAWENGIKGLYYQRGANPAQALARSIMTCTSCEA